MFSSVPRLLNKFKLNKFKLITLGWGVKRAGQGRPEDEGGSRMRLRRDHVVDRAIDPLDADGLDALPMRKLATRLGVQPRALYWHLAGKQALPDAMADRFLEGFTAD